MNYCYYRFFFSLFSFSMPLAKFQFSYPRPKMGIKNQIKCILYLKIIFFYLGYFFVCAVCYCQNFNVFYVLKMHVQKYVSYGKKLDFLIFLILWDGGRVGIFMDQLIFLALSFRSNFGQKCNGFFMYQRHDRLR